MSDTTGYKNVSLFFSGIWGSSRANGFIAFDDITFFGGSCSSTSTRAFEMILNVFICARIL